MEVTCYDDLSILRVQGIERVQEFFCRRALRREEIQIIHQQRITLAETPTKCTQFPRVHGMEKPVCELLSRGKTDIPLRMCFADTRIYSFEQMRFARSD